MSLLRFVHTWSQYKAQATLFFTLLKFLVKQSKCQEKCQKKSFLLDNHISLTAQPAYIKTGTPGGQEGAINLCCL